jgi:hypothetical protein
METTFPTVRLGEVCELIPARSLRSKGEVEVTAITTACLTEVGFDPTGLKQARMDSDDALQATVESGEVLVARSNTAELVGRVAVYGGRPSDVVASDLVIRVRPSSDVDPTYLGTYLSMLFATGYWKDRAGGASGSMKKIRRTQLRAVELQLPTLSTQREVAAGVLEQLNSTAEAQESARSQVAAAESLTAAYLGDAFDGEEAAAWPVVRIGDVLRRRTEIVHPKNNPSGPATFVGLEHIEGGTGRRLGSEPIEKSELTGRRAQFYSGDIVYGYLRPYLNKVWVAEFEGLCSVDQYVYTYDEERVEPEFMAAFMRSPVFLRRAPVGASPGQLPRIRTGEVDAVEVGLPSLEIQRRVVDELRQRREEVQRMLSALRSQLNAINALPAALLRETFDGHL